MIRFRIFLVLSLAFLTGAGADAPQTGTWSGVYRSGFEQSAFYTDQAEGPWWLEAEGNIWEEILSFRTAKPGRGSFITVRMKIEGVLEQGAEGYGHLGMSDGRIHVTRILSIAAISPESFDAFILCPENEESENHNGENESHRRCNQQSSDGPAPGQNR